MGYVKNLNNDYIVSNPKDGYYLMFSRNLRSALNARRWDARTLSRNTGIQESNISRYLSGERLPSLYSFGLIVKALECDVEDLLDY